MAEYSDFLIRRDKLTQTQFATAQLPEVSELRPGQALFKLDCFALTANNITYAAFGDAMQYWAFFPAPESFGRLPVWGFADVVGSNESGLEPGERVFGFWPMSTACVLDVGRLNTAGFEDVAEHRSKLPAVYNRYTRAAGDPGYQPALEGLQMVYRPLFMTDFLLADFIVDNNGFGATQIVMSSASSKTAFGLAFLLSNFYPGQFELIGLTSPGNLEFVAGLGCYARAATYDSVSSLDAQKPTLYVDFAGSAVVRNDIHEHWADQLKYSCAVGGTHWDAIEQGAQMPGPQPELFFAPAQMAKRLQDWGGAVLQGKYAKCWQAFAPQAGEWTEIVAVSGKAAMQDTYLKMVEGTADPRQGYILSF